jgi:hypothetical protein
MRRSSRSAPDGNVPDCGAATAATAATAAALRKARETLNKISHVGFFCGGALV